VAFRWAIFTSALRTFVLEGLQMRVSSIARGVDCLSGAHRIHDCCSRIDAMVGQRAL
jgi:hypothetical protein